MKYTYKKVGVDVEKSERFANEIKKFTNLPEWVLKEPMGYAAVLTFTTPPIAVTVDGIGTKLILHKKYSRWEDAALDLVAMNYNDLVCVGAKPMAFLDYLGVKKIEKEHEDFIKALIKILEKYNMVLVAGETAEMGDIYVNEWDAVGFAIGLIKRKYDISKIKPGDVIIGIPSNGFHSNGWSLIRKIIESERIDINKLPFDLLSGTRIYTKVLCVENIKAVAHVTGGGILRALKRTLCEKGYKVYLKKREFIDWIMKYVEFTEAIGIFNMGYGMLIFTERSDAGSIAKFLEGEIIGEVKEEEKVIEMEGI